MSNDEHYKGTIIPVELIRATVMPPYEFQKPQNGFGSAGLDQIHNLNKGAINPVKR